MHVHNKNPHPLPDNIRCLVCDALASGIHFGVFTCESCKLFFLRISRSETRHQLKCKKSSQCPISESNRSSCRACRYQRCLRVGMAKDRSFQGRNARLKFEKFLKQGNNKGNYAACAKKRRLESGEDSSDGEEEGKKEAYSAPIKRHGTSSRPLKIEEQSSSSSESTQGPPPYPVPADWAGEVADIVCREMSSSQTEKTSSSSSDPGDSSYTSPASRPSPSTEDTAVTVELQPGTQIQVKQEPSPDMTVALSDQCGSSGHTAHLWSHVPEPTKKKGNAYFENLSEAGDESRYLPPCDSDDPWLLMDFQFAPPYNNITLEHFLEVLPPPLALRLSNMNDLYETWLGRRSEKFIEKLTSFPVHEVYHHVFKDFCEDFVSHFFLDSIALQPYHQVAPHRIDEIVSTAMSGYLVPMSAPVAHHWFKRRIRWNDPTLSKCNRHFQSMVREMRTIRPSKLELVITVSLFSFLSLREFMPDLVSPAILREEKTLKSLLSMVLVSTSRTCILNQLNALLYTHVTFGAQVFHDFLAHTSLDKDAVSAEA